MRDFTPSLVLNCVVNSFLSYATVMLNIVLIFALRRTSSLPKTLKALILSVAVSDIGVGVLVQPLYIARLLMEIKNTNHHWNETYKDVVRTIGRTLGYVSFFGVTTISVDRFLAIHLHLKHQDLLTYQEIVTYTRVVAIVILSWLLGAFLALTGVLSSSKNIFNLAGVSVGLVCLLTMGLAYFKISIAVRRHTVQVHAQPAQAVASNEENRSNFERLRKTAVGTFYVYLLFLACHLPIAIVILTGRKTNKKRQHFKIYAHTLLYLSSSLVPLVYCWKFRHIRCAVKNILRNTFASQNQIQED